MLGNIKQLEGRVLWRTCSVDGVCLYMSSYRHVTFVCLDCQLFSFLITEKI
jgi:hypothetical protein